MSFRRKAFFRLCFPKRENTVLSFHDAVEKWPVERLRRFLETNSEDFDVDISNADGKSVLQVLTEKKIRDDKDLQKIDVLLSFGADPLFMSIDRGDYIEKSVLYRAFLAGATDLVMKFLQYVDIHQPVELQSHRVPIHCASELGPIEVVRYLLKKGANVEHLMDDAITPLHLSMRQPDTEITKLLIDHGASVNARNSRGDSTIHFACYWDATPHIDILLDHGADLTIIDGQGRSPLHIFLEKKADSREVCEKMLKKGADLSPTPDTRQTPLHFLIKSLMCKYKPVKGEITKLLIEHGTPVNAQDCNGNTALHLAASCFAEPIMFCLLQAGADVNIRNNSNITAFSMCTVLGDDIGLQILTYLAVQERKGQFTFSYIILDVVNYSTELRNRLQQCRAELDAMAACKLENDLTFSLFDVFKSSSSVVARFTRNERVNQMMQRFKAEDYPIFGHTLKRNYLNGVRRNDAETVGAAFLQEVSNCVLDAHCCEQIMKFIPTSDLERLAGSLDSSTKKKLSRKKKFWRIF